MLDTTRSFLSITEDRLPSKHFGLHESFFRAIDPRHQDFAGINYFVKVNTVACGGSKPNMTGSVILKIFKVGIIFPCEQHSNLSLSYADGCCERATTDCIQGSGPEG